MVNGARNVLISSKKSAISPQLQGLNFSESFFRSFVIIGTIKFEEHIYTTQILQVCIPIGCVPPVLVDRIREGLPNPGWSASRRGPHLGGVRIQRGLPNPGGSTSRGDLPNWGGLSNPGRCLHLGGSAQPQGVCIQRIYTDPLPPWTEWLTDRCKNITLPQIRCGR